MSNFLLKVSPKLLLAAPSWIHVLLISLLVWSFFSIVSKKDKPKNLPPSPPTLPIIGNVHQLGKLLHISLWKLSQKYGPVMLLHFGSTPTLIVSSPETAKQVLKTHDIDCCSRPYSYGSNKITYNSQDISYSPYNNHWREMRKVCILELFSMKRVRFFQFIRDQEVKNLVHGLSQISETETQVALNEKLCDVMNSIICRTAFGKKIVEKQYQNNEIEMLMVEVTSLLGCLWFADIFPVFGIGKMVDKLRGMHRRLDKCFKTLDSFFEKVVDEHLDPERPKPEREDLVDVLLGLWKDKSAPVRLSRDHIKAITYDILAAGTDTSSLTTTWAMAELVRNPRVMQKVQAEIRNQVGEKAMVEGGDVENLTYLKMVVKETLRLHPAAALLLPHETMRKCTIGGFDIYPKTRILVNAWAIGRDPNAWENPQEFLPERFEDNEVDFKGGHFEFVPFGGGRRICPALVMAVTNVEFTLANLLYCFDWKLPNGIGIEDVCMEEEGDLLIHKKLPLVLVPIRHNWKV